ncbi:hypothetical protein BJ508DRAFT_303089 [Ascobolus immersus RN42]|uniref:Uncharacterized protein n=1 Tax=Ascobolus immersus RN42 TaxID=1160509 RepID=A0A3N4ILH4_ASCIM|nr:hypothetical protein BJ508DRAFT_303089 [Ascobolus immersus RN42]
MRTLTMNVTEPMAIEAHSRRAWFNLDTEIYILELPERKSVFTTRSKMINRKAQPYTCKCLYRKGIQQILFLLLRSHAMFGGLALMVEVNQAHQKAKSCNQMERAPDPDTQPIHHQSGTVTSSQPFNHQHVQHHPQSHASTQHAANLRQAISYPTLAPEMVEIGVVLYTRVRSQHASRRPVVFRVSLNLNDIIPDWHDYLYNLALRHTAWVERPTSIQYDTSQERHIFVGEVVGASEPAQSPIQSRMTGSIRQLLYYSLLKKSSESKSTTGVTKRPARQSMRSCIGYSSDHSGENVPPPERLRTKVSSTPTLANTTEASPHSQQVEDDSHGTYCLSVYNWKGQT